MTTIKLFKSDVRDFLLSFLDENAPQVVFFLDGLWKEQANAITYEELQKALFSGEINQKWFGQWQQGYSQFVAEHLQPLWISAMQEAAERQKEKSFGWKFDSASEDIKRWTSQMQLILLPRCLRIRPPLLLLWMMLSRWIYPKISRPFLILLSLY